MKKRFLILFGLGLLTAMVLEASAFGQCSMCRASLAGSGNALFIRNFNIGVLVLLVPPVAMFCAIFFALRRHKTPGNESHDSDPVDR